MSDKPIEISHGRDRLKVANEIIAIVRDLRSTQMQHARHFQAMVEEKPRGLQLTVWQRANDQYLRLVQQYEDLVDDRLREFDGLAVAVGS